jgi:multiple sugar transport system substrate-binding protein
MSQKSEKGISRRTFLKGTGVTLAGAALGGKFQTQGIFKPNLVRRQKEVILAVQEFAFDAIKAVLPDFESSTGLTVTLEGGPASGDEMVTKYSTAFASNNSPIDVFSDADQSNPLFARAGWLLPLTTDVIPQATWDDFPESMDSQIESFSSFNGEHYRVPHGMEVSFFWTRKDWLDEKGLTAPTTWDEMVSVGQEFTDPANDVWGTTDGLLKPGLLFVYVAYLAAQAGGETFAFDEQTGVAMQFLYDMIHKYKIFPETALNDDYNKQNELYMADKVAFMRQWPYFVSVSEGDTDWYAPDKAKIELPPAGPAGSHAWWGSWGWAVPSSAPNLDGAKALIQYITSNEIAPKLAEVQSWFVMPRASIVKAFEGQPNLTLDTENWYAEQGVTTARPFHPKQGEAELIVEDMASLFLTDQASLSDVLKQGQQQIAALSE